MSRTPTLFLKSHKGVSINHIPAEHQSKFIQDTLEDLNQLDLAKIVGLGVTEEEFEKWKKRCLK